MPYIKKSNRSNYSAMLNACPPINTKGDLEYLIYWLMKKYMSDKERRYSNLHDTVFAAMHCSLEYQRRELDKREDEAIVENGDIDGVNS